MAIVLLYSMILRFFWITLTLDWVPVVYVGFISQTIEEISCLENGTRMQAVTGIRQQQGHS